MWFKINEMSPFSLLRQPPTPGGFPLCCDHTHVLVHSVLHRNTLLLLCRAVWPSDNTKVSIFRTSLNIPKLWGIIEEAEVTCTDITLITSRLCVYISYIPHASLLQSPPLTLIELTVPQSQGSCQEHRINRPTRMRLVDYSISNNMR